jgi:hypothetical protein
VGFNGAIAGRQLVVTRVEELQILLQDEDVLALIVALMARLSHQAAAPDRLGALARWQR